MLPIQSLAVFVGAYLGSILVLARLRLPAAEPGRPV
jgi:hypothetical protein